MPTKSTPKRKSGRSSNASKSRAPNHNFKAATLNPEQDDQEQLHDIDDAKLDAMLMTAVKSEKKKARRVMKSPRKT